MKARVIACVRGCFFFNTIRYWTSGNLLGDCKVEGNCCCRAMFFFNLTLPSNSGDSLGDCEVQGKCCFNGEFFVKSYPLLKQESLLGSVAG